MSSIRSRRRALRTCLGALALGLVATGAHAVRLNPDGTGQVLLFPYYTSRGGNQTVVTIVNHTDRTKALNVRLREGRNGRATLNYNLYLGPRDSWSGVVFAIDSNRPSNLIPTDPSCTYPTLNDESLLDGRGYAPLLEYEYTGANNDAGPDEYDRIAEGTITVIETGNFVPTSALARAVGPTPAGVGLPVDCGAVAAAWNGGAWSTQPATDLTNPTGGVSGEAMILNVSAGTVMSYDATALDDFRVDPADLPAGSRATVVAHAHPNTQRPTLADALSDPAAAVARATIDLPKRRMDLEYPATRAIDAVSAVLMADTATINYASDIYAGATTEWVVTLPTKAFYTDEAIVGTTAIAPFATVYPRIGSDSAATVATNYTLYERTGRKVPTAAGGTSAKLELRYTTQIVSVAPRAEGVPSLRRPLGSALVSQLAYIPASARHEGGTMEINFAATADGTRALRPSTEGTVLYGLPTIGFAAVNYINDNNGNSDLANYSLAKPQRRTQDCRRNLLKCDVSSTNTQQ
ncbi:MAG TPA: hypothetical protein VJ724_13860 [Tahibacter sp.]|nr:hypothetical protein [Tahibacter sp.]